MIEPIPPASVEIVCANTCAIPLHEIDRQLAELDKEGARLTQLLHETRNALTRLETAKVTLTLLALPYRAQLKQIQTTPTPEPQKEPIE